MTQQQQKEKLDWWRCWGCGRKCPEEQVVWLLTGPVGQRREPYHPECAEKVTLEEQWYPEGGCMAMPTLREGKVVCSKCGQEYVEVPDGAYHP